MFGNKKKEEDSMSYGIIGLGRFGTALATTLAQAGKEIMVLDRDEEKVKQMRLLTEHAYVVRNLQKETLEETGIQNCDQVIVCVGTQVDVSILTTLNVINLGVPHVISKATSAEQGQILEKIGAEVVYPERDMAIRLAKRLISRRVFNLFELDDKTDISELPVGGSMVGKTVEGSQIRKEYGINIIAIGHNKAITTDIRPDYVLTQGDTLVVIGNRDNIKRLGDDMAE